MWLTTIIAPAKLHFHPQQANGAAKVYPFFTTADENRTRPWLSTRN